MKERIKELEDIAKEFLMHERFIRYGESIEEEYYEFYPDELKHFVELIRQEEREACAKVCEEVESRAEELWDKFAYPEDQGMASGARQCATAIRARGNT